MNDRRIEIENMTIKKMVKIYCSGVHKLNDICPSCLELYLYAEKRNIVCQFKEEKPACSDCLVHCYQKHYREKIKEVMRYAGPRILFYAPILTLYHFYFKFKFRPK